MTKLLLMGACPLPFENATRLTAHGARTWQFAQPLLDAGHQVTAVCLKDHDAYPPGTPAVEMRHEHGMTVHALDVTNYERVDVIQEIHDGVRPDCIVTSASSLPSVAAALLKTEAPLWVDQNGDQMAEAQMLAFTEGDDRALTVYAARIAQLLARGDVFSAQSARQRYALVGQLAAAGRLNKDTVGHEFVHVLPDAFEREFVQTRKVIRGELCSEDDFVVLWSGGFNTWTDVATLARALQKAMDADPNIHFVSTGGALPGLVESTYEQFCKAVSGGEHAARFHLLGWLPRADADNCCLEADVGINIDRPCYETELGSRTRLLAWWAASLPALTTTGCELAQAAADAGAVAAFPQGDADALAAQILDMASDPERREKIAQRAKALVRERFSFAATTGPLLDWVAKPTRAPDAGAARRPGDLDAAVLRELERQASAARAQLETIRSSRTWRLASKLHAITRRLGLK